MDCIRFQTAEEAELPFKTLVENLEKGHRVEETIISVLKLAPSYQIIERLNLKHLIRKFHVQSSTSEIVKEFDRHYERVKQRFEDRKNSSIEFAPRLVQHNMYSMLHNKESATCDCKIGQLLFEPPEVRPLSISSHCESRNGSFLDESFYSSKREMTKMYSGKQKKSVEHRCSEQTSANFKHEGKIDGVNSDTEILSDADKVYINSIRRSFPEAASKPQEFGSYQEYYNHLRKLKDDQNARKKEEEDVKLLSITSRIAENKAKRNTQLRTTQTIAGVHVAFKRPGDNSTLKKITPPNKIIPTALDLSKARRTLPEGIKPVATSVVITPPASKKPASNTKKAPLFLKYAKMANRI